MLDVLITGGQIIDGGGSPGFFAALGIKGEDLSIHRGDASQIAAARVIDARGRVVCPGFIDFHAHSGLVMLAEPRHEPKVRQGVTTEVIGVDGNSYAPFETEEDLSQFLEWNSGLDGNPPLSSRWATVEQYLALFDQRVAINVCYMVGNSPLRIASVGWRNTRAGKRTMAKMQSLLREAMEEGAWGMSTGLDYPPGSFADTDELIALCQTVARFGGIYHTHVRYSLGDRFLDPFKEAVEIGRRSGVATHITHLFQRATSPVFERPPGRGGASAMLELVENARVEGIDITFDMFPNANGGSRLLIMLPLWALDGGPTRLMELLQSPAQRARLHREILPRAPSWQDTYLTHFKHQRNKQYEGRSVAEVAVMRAQTEAEAVCDLLLDEDLQVSYHHTGISGLTLPKFIAHPLSVVGSDALLLGDYPTPQTYNCFPMILGEYVRDEKWLSLPEAIRKMTSFAAQRLGLPDRGLLRDGYKADVVVFDPAQVEARATRAKPKEFATGIEYVIVNGQVVVDNAVHQGVLPGRALRRGRARS